MPFYGNGHIRNPYPGPIDGDLVLTNTGSSDQETVMTRPMYYGNVTLNATGSGKQSLSTKGWLLSVSEKLTPTNSKCTVRFCNPTLLAGNNGGVAGQMASGGVPGVGDLYVSGGSGGTGSASQTSDSANDGTQPTSGGVGASNTSPYSGWGGGGGAGGTGGNSNGVNGLAGAAATASTYSLTTFLAPTHPFVAIGYTITISTMAQRLLFGGCGGSGGGRGAYRNPTGGRACKAPGGGGPAGGGFMPIIARSIDLSGGGQITNDGGAGGAGGTGDDGYSSTYADGTGGGGGAGGGGGGLTLMVYGELKRTGGTLSVTGGAGGAGGRGGNKYGSGVAGSGGSGGVGGGAGRIVHFTDTGNFVELGSTGATGATGANGT